MIGDELLPKRSPDKNQRLFMISGIYHVRYTNQTPQVEKENKCMVNCLSSSDIMCYSTLDLHLNLALGLNQESQRCTYLSNGRVRSKQVPLWSSTAVTGSALH